jgi:hypothetical protein
MTVPVCSCSRPIKDHAFLCLECTRTLERHLAEVPALAADLETTRTRTSRTGGRGIGIVVRSADRPVPWDDRASRVATELKALLVAWARLCQDVRERPDGPACRRCSHPSCAMLRSHDAPGDSVESLSQYLLASLPTLRHRPEVVAMADDLHRFRERAAKVIDRPAEETYYGPCGAIDYWPDGHPIYCSARCEADLYGVEDETELTCRACQAVHNLSNRRAMLLLEAQDRDVTASDLSKFLTAYGEPLTAERIRKWAERGQIIPRRRDPAGRPLYRVGDAVRLLSELNTPRRERSA